MSAKEFIVAIELGSSKVTGIAGRKNLDGSINVLAVAREESSSFIRKGVVYNIDKTALCISNIINKLSTQLKTQITQVYVGVGGQSIRSVRNTISRDFATGTKVTQDMVIELMDSNRNMRYPDLEILDAAAQEYKVDTVLQIDPVGIQCSHLEGTFLNILERTDFYKKLNRCFEAAGVNVAEMYLAPLALADSVLTETEKRSGCALIDIGYDTTTVSVYSKNILRHLSVVPLGSSNITKDISSLQIEESQAEKMKLQYASAYTENADIDNELMLSLGDSREVSSRKFIEIVEGRVEEIIENAWHQIPPAYTDKLLGGLIITGGGSNLKNIEKAFVNHTHIEKTRIAKFVTNTIISNNADINAKNGMMNIFTTPASISSNFWRGDTIWLDEVLISLTQSSWFAVIMVRVSSSPSSRTGNRLTRRSIFSRKLLGAILGVAGTQNAMSTPEMVGWIPELTNRYHIALPNTM